LRSIRGAYRAEAVVVRKRFSSEGQLSMRQERMLGVTLLVAGLVIAGLSVTQMRPDGVVHAQATPPASTSPQPPAESMPGGTRPTTPAPEPARPQNNSQGEGSTTGSSPAGSGGRTPLPPAPAEKSGPPIQQK
jgi:hypothetical protein